MAMQPTFFGNPYVAPAGYITPAYALYLKLGELYPHGDEDNLRFLWIHSTLIKLDLL